jgi:hypothetical protein
VESCYLADAKCGAGLRSDKDLIAHATDIDDQLLLSQREDGSV